MSFISPVSVRFSLVYISVFLKGYRDLDPQHCILKILFSMYTQYTSTQLYRSRDYWITVLLLQYVPRPSLPVAAGRGRNKNNVRRSEVISSNGHSKEEPVEPMMPPPKQVTDIRNITQLLTIHRLKGTLNRSLVC